MKPHRALKRRLFRRDPIQLNEELALEFLISNLRSEDIEAIARGDLPANADKIDRYSRRLDLLRSDASDPSLAAQGDEP